MVFLMQLAVFFGGTAVVNTWYLVGTYGRDKNLHIYIFLPTLFGPIYYRPPVIVKSKR